MTKKQIRSLKRLLVVLTLLLLAEIGFAVGKYFTTKTFSGSVTFTANLVANNGFSLVDNTPDKAVYLIPGVDIERNPHVVITGKTDIPAYLFVEIVDTLDSYNGKKLVEYNVTSNWLETNIPGANGGTVYVYTGGGEGAAKVLTGDPQNLDIPILEGDTLTVSQYVKSQDDTTPTDTDDLTFYAALVEKVGDETPAAAYSRINS